MESSNKDNILISVIMPVYNSDKYLAAAIESILNQDFDGFELILIDDGSKDNSASICQHYADLDSRINFIQKENGGVASARNTGLEAAKGQYIAFCDNDDIYYQGLLKDNYELAVRDDADLVRFGYECLELIGDNVINQMIITFPTQHIKREEFSGNYFKIRRVNTIWCGLYKNSVVMLNKLRFNENIKSGGDDLEFNLNFLAHCNSITLNEGVYYCWYKRTSQSTSFHLPKSLLQDESYLIDFEYERLHFCYDETDFFGRTEYLLRRYIVYILRSKKMSGYSMKEMISVFEEERKHPIFEGFFDKSCRKKLLKSCKSYYIYGLLFHCRCYRLMYLSFVMFHLVFER